MPHHGKYNVVSFFTNVQSGLKFRQLWQGGAAGARKELNRIFIKGKLKFGIVADNKDMSDIKENCFADSIAHIYCIALHALMDSR